MTDQKPAIYIEKSQNITVQGFKIVNSRRGIHAVESTGLVLKSSQLEDNVRQGIFFERSGAELFDLMVTKTKADQDGTHGEGVNFFDSQAVLKDSTMSENAFHGVILQGENNPTLTMDNCTVSNDRTLGVSLYQSAQATISNSRVTGTKKDAQGENGSGIGLQGNSKATIQKNTISDNQEIGIYVVETSRATIDDNTIAGSLLHGIAVSGSSEATITNNRITGSTYYGIQVYMQSKSTIRSNTITDNGDQGIRVGATSIQNESLTTDISSNTVQNNKSCGVFADSDTDIKITGKSNTISSNTGGQLCGTKSKFPKGFGGGK